MITVILIFVTYLLRFTHYGQLLCIVVDMATILNTDITYSSFTQCTVQTWRFFYVFCAGFIRLMLGSEKSFTFRGRYKIVLCKGTPHGMTVLTTHITVEHFTLFTHISSIAHIGVTFT